jgi:uncharacterized protein (DUF1501 family)
MPRSTSPDRSAGAVSRRTFLHAGLAALGGLTLPNVLRLRAAAGAESDDTAVIFVQLGGGPSQFETYDPKPEAPAEYRGAFSAIPTRVPGVRFCELMPRQAALMDRLAIVRSVTHREGSHIALHVVESGYFLQNSQNSLRGEMPAVGSVVARVRGVGEGGLPAFVSLPRHIAYCTPGYLGGQYAPFIVNEDFSVADTPVANLGLATGMTHDLLQERLALLHAFDTAPAALGGVDTAAAMSAFQAQALELLTGERARLAIDLTREPAALRDRYGRTDFGQRLLLSRRLVEAGVPFVMVRIRPGVVLTDWDDHENLPDKMRQRAPMFDQGLATLIEDLGDRGLARHVLVVAMGEFGRTPRINPNAGRDHWPAVSSVLLAGGDYRMGQAIGASDSRGGAVVASPYAPQSVLAMVYRHLGIDPALTFPDFSGRPRHVLEERAPIVELL